MTELSSFQLDPSAQRQTLEIAAELYRNSRLPGRWIQQTRPRICPFADLVSRFPVGSRVLDVGCGSGLLLGLLAKSGRLDWGVGFDASEKAIQRAREMQAGLEPQYRDRVEFLHRNINDAWPERDITVVSVVDVMHHCPPAAQEHFLKQAASFVPTGGLLIYKDMSRTPFWCAWANRLHDLVMAREWIHYCPIDDVATWGEQSGLRIVASGKIRMLWYHHEYLVFER